MSTFQVYNWQFVHSIHLWVQMIGDADSNALEPLIYPLVQLTNGTIRLNYSSKYFPLRFHLAKLLIRLSDQTGKYIPILPYYLDILNTQSLGKKSSKLTMKPMDFSCVLRLSKIQLAENGFKDATVEQVYCGLLESLTSLSHKISFPEVAIPALAQIKAFIKKCKVANYNKKMKPILDKIQENSKFIQDKRSKVTFGVRDLDQISSFETQLKTNGTPLSKYYETFKKIKETESLKKKAETKEEKESKNEPSGANDEDMELDEADDNSEGEEQSDEDDDDDDEDVSDEIEEEIVNPKEASSGKKRKKVIESKPAKKKKLQNLASSDEDSSGDDEEDDVVKDFDDFSDDD